MHFLNSSHRFHNAKPVSTMLRTQKWCRSQSPVLWECGQPEQWQEELSVCNGLVLRTLAAHPPQHTHTSTHTGNFWRMPSRRADADCTPWATSPLSLGSTLTNVTADTLELCIRVYSGCSGQVPSMFSHPERRASNLLDFCLHTDHLSQVCLCPSQSFGSSEEAGPCSRNPAILNIWR